jgi:predicted transposase/invertase (TIGR01784 family)
MENSEKKIPKDEPNKFVRFDWAAKRMLRDKANFGVLEGLITVLLNEPVHILEILESEGNQETEDDKFNRVDIKAKNSKDEIIIVEIQLTREIHYLERILYGVAKAITEHIQLGDSYDHVKKIYHISILYFPLGQGADYLYHGQTTFIGVHTHDELKVTTKENEVLRMRTPKEIFPEYYIIRVNEFNTVATTPLEEWIEYLKTGNIRPGTTAPGLAEAREKLRRLSMSKAEQDAYYRHISAVMVQNDALKASKLEGRAEGIAEGLEKGRAEGRAEGLEKGRAEGLEKGRAEARIETAKALKKNGVDEALIAKSLGLTIEEVRAL